MTTCTPLPLFLKFCNRPSFMPRECNKEVTVALAKSLFEKWKKENTIFNIYKFSTSTVLATWQGSTWLSNLVKQLDTWPFACNLAQHGIHTVPKFLRTLCKSYRLYQMQSIPMQHYVWLTKLQISVFSF